METFDYLEGGTIIAERYRIVSPLASGGFGAVYVAEQLATDRTVALKMLWPHLVHGGIDRFSMEARIAGRLNSEHIVQVLDAGMDAARRAPFLVMELLTGCDLEQLVEREGALPPARALEYLRQAAIGLDKAHRFVDRDGRPSPIVHRDLKPGNLFLSRRDDGSEVVKILDFGIAKVLSSSKSLSGGIRGTPLYMAYEQAAQAPITPAADVWSFGLIAFFLLTGKSYWKAARDPEQVLTRLFAEVLTLPLEPASQRARALGAAIELPAAFDAWFARAVNRDPSARMASIGQAVRELALALSVELDPTMSSSRRSLPAPEMPSFSQAPMPPPNDAAPAPSEALATSDLAALGRTQKAATRGRRLWLAVPAAALVAGAFVAFDFYRGRTADRPSGALDRASAQPSDAAAPEARSARSVQPIVSPSTAAPVPALPIVEPVTKFSAEPAGSVAAPPVRALAAKPRTVPASRPSRKSAAETSPSPSDPRRESTPKPQSIYGVR